MLESLGGLVKTQTAGPLPGLILLVGAQPELCVSTEFPHDADAAGLRIIL